MKLLLKEFQVKAVDLLVAKLRTAAQSVRSDDDLQSVCLSSPTGSGKTVIVTAAIERVLYGDTSQAPEPDAVFLWLSDQPELNEQTRRKMLVASSLLTSDRLVMIDATFDEPALRPGCVHFLNIQKLARDKALVSRGDERAYTIWETVTNTIRAHPRRFFVIIDEAHRGMGERQQARDEARTIVQRFIKSRRGELPPVPLVVGVSATPERFQRLIQGTGRTSHEVPVDADDVRSSGLLKELITLYHPHESDASDMTMLRAAVRSWRRFTDRWHAYCAAHGEPRVDPILVVQVQDGTATLPSRTSLAEAVDAIRAEAGELPSNAFAHSFEGGAPLAVGMTTLRYLAPPDIQDDADVRVVFFKTSLSTGWDCPRAEVMMSFRAAADPTSIAQLVGRMVRTPLARRVDADEFLNTVALYLPHYDRAGLDRVIEQLSRPDAENMAEVRVERGEAVATLARAPDLDEVFAALSQLPCYTIPTARKSSEVRRLMKLARLLAQHDIDDAAPIAATKVVLDVLAEAHAAARATPAFRQVVEERGQIEVRAVNWRVGTAAVQDGDVLRVDISAENVDDLFDAAGRRLGEGLHKAWWRARAEAGAADHTAIKLELFALCLDDGLLRHVEHAAQETVQAWLATHKARIAKLTNGDRHAYDEIRQLASRPEPRTVQYPECVECRLEGEAWERHVYVDDEGAFRAKLNTWEARVLRDELARSDVVAWLRNPDRKPWSFCVPYEAAGEYRPLYPDFLVVRQTPSGIEVDLLEPHTLALADAPSKAKGLAIYAAQHAPAFGRIELIIVEDDGIARLDLADETTRNRVKAVSTTEHLRELYASTRRAS